MNTAHSGNLESPEELILTVLQVDGLNQAALLSSGVRLRLQPPDGLPEGCSALAARQSWPEAPSSTTLTSKRPALSRSHPPGSSRPSPSTRPRCQKPSPPKQRLDHKPPLRLTLNQALGKHSWPGKGGLSPCAQDVTTRRSRPQPSGGGPSFSLFSAPSLVLSFSVSLRVSHFCQD